MPKAIEIAALALVALSASGCALFRSPPPPPAAPPDFSGLAERFAPDTPEFDIATTVGLVKSNGAPLRLARHGVTLPTWSVSSVATYEYMLPAECGGYRFRVLEIDYDQILELRHVMADGQDVVIRDYVMSSNPFVTPGLWTSNDHIEAEVPDMMAQLVRTSSSLFPQVYSRGRVTTLPSGLRAELGSAYRSATQAASHCPA